jgi:pimeloyl-ACP methyl ester carboxylesterase
VTKIFVHGNPETAVVWQRLVAALSVRGIDSVACVSPPGFGAPLPSGFDPTPQAYVDWLASELAAVDGPIDLVGHDWGAGHVLGLLDEHADVVRSWVVDCAGLVHHDYEWHDMAQAWQTPELGEQVVALMTGGTVDDRIGTFTDIGLPEDTARGFAEAADETMGRAILGLYRGARQPYMRELGERLAATSLPAGHVVIGSDDPYVPADLGADMASRLGASATVLEGHGHWWMVHAPDASAEALVTFWASLD